MERVLSRIFRTPPQAVPPDTSPEIPETDSIAYEFLLDPGPRVLITAFGCDPTLAGDMINSSSEFVRQDNHYPVLAACGLSTAFLVSVDLPTETLPSRIDMHLLTKAEYNQYVSARWRIILGKWKIRETLDLGSSFEDFLTSEMSIEE